MSNQLLADSPPARIALEWDDAALHQAGDADLVDHLAQLAAAGRPHQTHHARVALDHGLCRCIGLLLATDHHGQHTIDRTGLTTGYRRIEKTQAMLGRNSRQLTRHIGRGGGVID